MVTTAKVEAYSVPEAVAKVDAIHKAFGTRVDVDIAILATEDEEEAIRLGYSFPWLKGNKTQGEGTATRKVGAIQFAQFDGIGNQPQRVASAASEIEHAALMGATYKPILYIGEQIVSGTKYWFICEQTLVTAIPEKHIVKLAVNEFQGNFELVGKSLEVIF